MIAGVHLARLSPGGSTVAKRPSSGGSPLEPLLDSSVTTSDPEVWWQQQQAQQGQQGTLSPSSQARGHPTPRLPSQVCVGGGHAAAGP